ncbi:MAG: heme ABC transporter permease [Rhodospirillales bacterium]|jgi:heme exporter protein C
MFNYFANPTRYLRLASKLQPMAVLVTLLTTGLGLYYALFQSPPDYQQGETVRMMYVHVPAAWMAMFCYVTLACSSAAALIWRHLVANIIAKSTAPIGACFTFLALTTGSLWGKPMWGSWWVWDARLTSVLILFFLYLGYMVLYNAFDDTSRGARAAAILSIVGVINIPIIKFSVDWWNTLHQPASIVKMGGPVVHPSMLTPLILMSAGYTALYFWILFIRTRAELNTHKIHALHIRQAGG